MSLLRDEQGKVSTARCAMWVTLLAILYLAIVGPDRTGEVWAALKDIALALIGWAGGSRVMEYVAAMRRTPGPTPEDTGITPGDPSA